MGSNTDGYENIKSPLGGRLVEDACVLRMPLEEGFSRTLFWAPVIEHVQYLRWEYPYRWGLPVGYIGACDTSGVESKTLNADRG